MMFHRLFRSSNVAANQANVWLTEHGVNACVVADTRLDKLVFEVFIMAEELNELLSNSDAFDGYACVYNPV